MTEFKDLTDLFRVLQLKLLLKMGFKYKKGVKVKKKPKKVSQFIDFANETESQSIEVPTIQGNITSIAPNKESNLINFFDSWTMTVPVTYPSPDYVQNIYTIYTFTKNSKLSDLILEIKATGLEAQGYIDFILLIMRQTTVLFRWDFHMTTVTNPDFVLQFEKTFQDLVLMTGDRIDIQMPTVALVTVGTDIETRIKGVINL